MRCPECKSDNILWDYKAGTVVCCNCGLVIDYIYEETKQKYGTDLILNFNTKTYNKTKYRVSEIYIIKSRIKMYHKLVYRTKEYYKIARKLKKKSIVLDEKAFREYLEGKRGHVRLFRHKHITLAENIPEKVREIIKKIIDNDPVLASRTERAKIALAYIILGLLENGGNLNLHKIAKTTSLSVTHVKRLLATLRQRPYVLKAAQHLLSASDSYGLHHYF